MSVEAHLETLEKKHGQLEEELRFQLGRPSTHDETVIDIKRKKLRLKDQITKLKADPTH